MSWFGQDQDENGFAQVNVGIGANSPLYQMLMCEDIVPGDEPSYQMCKTIYVYHVLGGKMVEAPVKLAQSQERELTFTNGPEEALRREFLRVRKDLNIDTHIKTTKILSKVYGQAALAFGVRGENPSSPIDFKSAATGDIYFNVLDPLNTAGSLVLNQDPNAPDFMKPNTVSVGSQHYHGSRTVVMMNGPPVYIQWTNSAFGYVGRSDYQRVLFPLKTFIQTMITDDMVTKKAGLLVAKLKQAGSIVNNMMASAMGQKRVAIKSGATGNVLSVGHDDSIETLNMMNLEGPAKFARDNCLKNIATGNGMPASILNQDTLAEGFGEGSEDAKQIARFIDGERQEMNPLYTFTDKIVMHRAWTPDFYEAIKATIPEYADVPYETAFRAWVNGFEAIWPNLLQEPESEVLKGEKDRFESATALVEVLAPLVQDPENRAKLAMWLAETANSREKLFSVPIELDEQLMIDYTPPPLADIDTNDTKEPEAKPFREGE